MEPAELCEVSEDLGFISRREVADPVTLPRTKASLNEYNWPWNIIGREITQCLSR